MNKIVVDAFGGDNSPKEIIKGAVESLNSQNKYDVVLVGNKEIIENELKQYQIDFDRIEIVDAREVITNDDVPTEAIRQKKDSSIVVGMETLKNRDDCVAYFSAGSTGANLTGAIFKVGRIKGIMRPCLAPVLPTVKGTKVLMLDIGANVDCKPEYLAQFAIMGTSFMEMSYKIKNPRVAILSNGTEDHKGNELTKAAFSLIKEIEGINFVGNMEARDILSGNYDVIVADGFDGNIALKGTEGAILSVLTFLKQGIKESFISKIGALFMKKTFKKLKNTLDYNKNGGAVMLGIDKVIVKGHGSSKAESVKAALSQAYGLYESKYIDDIKKRLEKYKNE